MPFDELETITKGNEPPTATISYCLAWRKPNGRAPKTEKKPRLMISLPTTICGLAKSKSFKLFLGSGADLGKLLMRGDHCIRTADEAKKAGKPPAGFVVPSEHAHFFRWNFGFVPKLGEEEHFEGERHPVRKVSDEEFEITIPKSWFEGAES